MSEFYIAWAVTAIIVGGAAVLIGALIGQGALGILIDQRGRYSLTKVQLVLWSVVVLSLIVGLFVARIAAGLGDALAFAIPNELLVVMGISIGSAATATAVKAGKDASVPERIAASSADDKPRLAQIFLQEEGEMADKVVDVAKFQNFWFTALLVSAYVALVIASFGSAGDASTLALPGFDDTFLTLLGISHAGYVAGKLPNQAGTPSGLTLALKRADAVPTAAADSPPTPPTFEPRVRS